MTCGRYTAYKGIGHVVRRECKLFDFHQNVALRSGAVRRTRLGAIDVGEIDQEIRGFYLHGSRILRLRCAHSSRID